jgi:hypothetical protein
VGSIRRSGGAAVATGASGGDSLKYGEFEPKAITASTAHCEPQQRQGEIASLSNQMEEAHEEAELNLLMLEQALEEVDFYYLALQQKEQLLQSQQQQLQRAEVLIQALLERLEQQG